MWLAAGQFECSRLAKKTSHPDLANGGGEMGEGEMKEIESGIESRKLAGWVKGALSQKASKDAQSTESKLVSFFLRVCFGVNGRIRVELNRGDIARHVA
jgi:hypothetical protein